MTQRHPQVPWTDEQWALVTQAIQDEASRSRVAASFVPLEGPLPPDTDFVRKQTLEFDPQTLPPRQTPLPQPPEWPPQQSQKMRVDDKHTTTLATIQVNVQLRGGQMADPNLTSALQMFRRAAKVIARLEDALVFRGQLGPDLGPPEDAINQLPSVWAIHGGQTSCGLVPYYGGGTVDPYDDQPNGGGDPPADPDPIDLAGQVRVPGNILVATVSRDVGALERAGYFGPFAVVLSDRLFTAVQTPNDSSLVLPQDRIIPFLGGGPLLRSSTLNPDTGIVVALGSAPIDLVVATDVTLRFLQATEEPKYIFRVYEKIVLRVKECQAIRLISLPRSTEMETSSHRTGKRSG